MSKYLIRESVGVAQLDDFIADPDQPINAN